MIVKRSVHVNESRKSTDAEAKKIGSVVQDRPTGVTAIGAKKQYVAVRRSLEALMKEQLDFSPGS